MKPTRHHPLCDIPCPSVDPTIRAKGCCPREDDPGNQVWWHSHWSPAQSGWRGPRTEEQALDEFWDAVAKVTLDIHERKMAAALEGER